MTAFHPFCPHGCAFFQECSCLFSCSQPKGNHSQKRSSSLSWLWYLAKFFRNCLVNFYSCQSVKKAELDMLCLNWICYCLLTLSQTGTPFSIRNIYTDLIISCDYSWCKKIIASLMIVKFNPACRNSNVAVLLASLLLDPNLKTPSFCDCYAHKLLAMNQLHKLSAEKPWEICVTPKAL